MTARHRPTPAPVLARGEEIERVILKGSRKALSRRALHVALEPVLRSWIGAACTWDSPILGDYRFVIFSVAVAPDTEVYVQFWSEPLEPVLWEVSSGHWNPPTDEWLAGRRAKRIEALGFTIGGQARNYRREIRITTPAEQAAVAKTVVRILFDAFDYRGSQPLKAHLSYQGRAELQATFDSFTPEDVAKVFAALGYRVETPAEPRESEPVIRCRKRGAWTLVRFDQRVPDQNLFRRAHFSTELDLTAEEHERLRGASDVPADARPVVSLSVTHPFGGGVTSTWLVERINEWEQAASGQRRAVRRALREGARPKELQRVH